MLSILDTAIAVVTLVLPIYVSIILLIFNLYMKLTLGGSTIKNNLCVIDCGDYVGIPNYFTIVCIEICIDSQSKR